MSKLLESDIEDYFVKHLDEIDDDLVLLKRQYIVNYKKKRIGIIDILCIQGLDKRYVIIENKRGELKGIDVGQVLSYYKIFKSIDAISNVERRQPKIILIATSVGPQFEIACEALLDLGMEIEVKIVMQDSEGKWFLEDYFSESYGRLKIPK